jgi:hypothetical protein
MANANVEPEVEAQKQGSPYCSDPNCQSCKDLREVQEAIRLHLPIPIKKKTISGIHAPKFPDKSA